MPDEEGVGYYDVHNPELTLNNQGWMGAISGSRHLEGRRNLDLDRSNRILFEMLRSGMTDPHSNVDTLTWFYSRLCLSDLRSPLPSTLFSPTL